MLCEVCNDDPCTEECECGDCIQERGERLSELYHDTYD